MITGKMLGGQEMRKILLDIAKKYPDDVAKAAYQEGQVEVTEMKRRCPVDITEDAPHPGNLRASIHLEEPERKGRTIILTFATGTQAPYAIYVHENPDAIHPIGEWKFMENPLKESAPYFLNRVGERVNFNKHGTAKQYLGSSAEGD